MAGDYGKGKDCSKWANEHLHSLLCNIDLDEAGVTRTTDRCQVKGDAMMYNPKGTPRAIYDMSATCAWEAGAKGGEVKAVGLLTIREITPDALRDGLEVTARVTDLSVSDPETQQKMAELVTKVAGRSMGGKVREFVKDLHVKMGTKITAAETAMRAGADYDAYADMGEYRSSGATRQNNRMTLQIGPGFQTRVLNLPKLWG